MDVIDQCCRNDCIWSYVASCGPWGLLPAYASFCNWHSEFVCIVSTAHKVRHIQGNLWWFLCEWIVSATNLTARTLGSCLKCSDRYMHLYVFIYSSPLQDGMNAKCVFLSWTPFTLPYSALFNLHSATEQWVVLTEKPLSCFWYHIFFLINAPLCITLENAAKCQNNRLFLYFYFPSICKSKAPFKSF